MSREVPMLFSGPLDAWAKIYGPNPDALTDYCWVIEFKHNNKLTHG